MREGKPSALRNLNSPARSKAYEALRAEEATAAILYGNIVRRIFSSHLSGGDTVLGGGAFHMGHTLAMVDQVAPLGRVIAFEVSEHAVAALRVRADAEDFGDAIEIRQALLADYNGLAEFPRATEAPQAADRPWSSAMRARAISFTAAGGVVPVIRLDDAVEAGKPVRMLVLDLAGGELAALRGARRILSEARPLLLFRDAGRHAVAAHGDTGEELGAFFADIGYELHDILGFRFDAQDWGAAHRANWYLGVPGEDQVSKGTLHGMIDDVIHQHGLSAAFI